MVGTLQSNRTGADVKDVKEAMKNGTYKSVLFQHKDKPLCFALWSDNSVVKTLSNFHFPNRVCRGVWGIVKEEGRRWEEGASLYGSVVPKTK